MHCYSLVVMLVFESNAVKTMLLYEVHMITNFLHWYLEVRNVFMQFNPGILFL